MLPKTAVHLTSILDNDFYKFTMQCAVAQLFPNAKARYAFINRGNHDFPPGFGIALRQAVDAIATLRLCKEEKQFLLSNCPYLSPVYLDLLEGYQYDPTEVDIRQEGTNLQIHVEGYWYRAILWEVPLLALVSELYYELNDLPRDPDEEVSKRTANKIISYNKLGVTIAEFGTRRRHSYKVHRLVMEALKQHRGESFVGTSNVHFSMLYQMKPIGTHAHEWFMFHAAKYGFKLANALGLENWVEVYRGDLGIALSDTYTTDVFFRSFDKKFGKLFDGVRHDSGDPLSFATKTIEHYKRLGINPLSKTIIFSDALNYGKVIPIAEFCKGKIGFSFGIGTNFTNDAGVKPMNIVMKLVEAFPEKNTWIPVVKLSDETGKYTGDPAMIGLAKQLLQLT
ncbi:nicotinate phosphoribosyltransferase [Segetibacter sp. 3557_3]|uniref:nicotinate phosphoribosyltransferase n=1 Tax=Segetibacter sp. 3557_3 TaxID=2547429 RepID=UPI001058C121|nr:nicotinate phosphoribosyltransferase [Segetibacter sp. 3557_3]TDH26419.1 nicotinate phosphoribosyltransferase [Segetibacter sp. 3557_3]